MFVISDVLWYVLITNCDLYMLSQVYCRTVGLFVICKFISGVLLLHYVLINCDLRLSSQVYCGMFWLIVIYVFCLRCTVVFCDLDVCHFQCAIDVLIVIYVFLRGTVVFWLWFACLLFPVCYRCFDYLWFVCSSSQVYCNTFWLIVICMFVISGVLWVWVWHTYKFAENEAN